MVHHARRRIVPLMIHWAISTVHLLISETEQFTMNTHRSKRTDFELKIEYFLTHYFL